MSFSCKLILIMQIITCYDDGNSCRILIIIIIIFQCYYCYARFVL